MAETLAQLRAAHLRYEVKGCVLKKADYPDQPIRERLYPRREIDVFAEDTDCCNLFLLALLVMQDGSYAKKVDLSLRRKMMDKDPFSWFNICAIHGRPYGRVWAGVNRNSGKKTNQWAPLDFPEDADEADIWGPWGYCSHASVLFPTWHRMYLTLMEQTVYLKMHDIAIEYPKKDGVQSRMIEAANRFRFPYWDPLRPRKLYEPQMQGLPTWQCGVPKILLSNIVYVSTPKDPFGRFKRRNPLYNYEFPEGPEFKYDDNRAFGWTLLWGKAQKPPEAEETPNIRTQRCPNLKGKSDHESLNSQFANPSLAVPVAATKIADLGSRLYSLLSQPRDYNRFSNKAFWNKSRIIDPNTRKLAVFDPSFDWGAFDEAKLERNPGESDLDFNRRKEALSAAKDVAKAPFQTAAQGSLEGVHDTVHSWCGSSWDRKKGEAIKYRTGHMTAPELSSYDPIFWLHHMQVERIFSMWQVLYAPASFEFNFEQYASLSTTAEPKGLRQTQLSPLMPFWKSKTDNHGDGLFWTSRDCQNWTVLGYDYEETGELGNWGVGGPLLRDMEKPRLTAWVNTLYRWTSPSGRVNSVTGELPNMEELHESFRPPTREIAGYPRSYKNVKCLGAHVFNDGHIWAWGFDFTDVLGSHPPNRTALLKSRTPLTVDPGPLVTRTEHEEMSRSRKPLPVVEAAWSAPLDPLREWDVHVIWQKFAVNCSFHIDFFIGDFDSDPLKWHNSLALVATVFNWASRKDGGCPDCKDQAEFGLVVSDTAHLTQALAEHISRGKAVHGIKLRSLEPNDVIPFLKRNLHWRVRDALGTEHHRDDIGDLTVMIAERLVTPAESDDQFPSYGDYTSWTEITHGRPGGLDHDKGFGEELV